MPVPQASIPTLARPTKQESNAAGKREYAEGLPQITAAPGTPEYDQQQLEVLDYQKAHPWGSDVSTHPGTFGKIGHVAAAIGNVVGNVVAPKQMAAIPGTEQNERAKEAQWTARLGEAEGNKLKEAEATSWQPMTFTGPDGEQIQAPARFAGTLGAAGIRAGTAERGQDIHKDTAAAAEQGRDTRFATGEQGKDTRFTEGQQGENARNAASNETRTTIADLNRQFMGSFQPILGNNGEVMGFYNTKNPASQRGPEGGPVGAAAPGAAPPGAAPAAGGAPAASASPLTHGTTASGARLENTTRNQFNVQYVNPANQAETQYQRATQAVDAYNSNPKTGAAAMVLFAQHLGTTLGGIKGAAIGEGAQKTHADAIGLEDRMNRFVDNLKTGQPLSANQVHDFYDLISKTRNLQWETTAREAARRQIPIDFLPDDVQIHLKSPDGREQTTVPGNRVQQFVQKGARVEY